MDVYALIQHMLLDLPAVKSWPDMRGAVESMVMKRPRDRELPIRASLAVGGTAEQAIPAAAAIACLQISIILIDDMLDADPRGAYHRIGTGATANLASAFQATGLQAIVAGDSPREVKMETVGVVNRMMLETAYGQHLDIRNPYLEDDYWTLVRTKSAPFFGAALYIGARLGGGSAHISAEIQQLGHRYGEMIQIHDDLKDTMEVPANPDWISGRNPLPIIFAQSVDHPDRKRFLELRKRITDPGALSEAQEILIRCGAVSYCAHHLIQRYKKARTLLSRLSLINTEPLNTLLDQVIDPVMALLKDAGVEEPRELLNTLDAGI